MNTVTILIGQDKIPFHVHEAHLTDAFPYFAAAFAPDKFKEGQDRSITLHQFEVDTFEHFANWLYSRRVDLPLGPYDDSPGSWYTQRNERIAQAIRLYILADTVLVDDLKGNVLKFLMDVADGKHGKIKEKRGCPSCANVELVYANAPPRAPLRRLMTDWYIWWCESSWWATIEGREWLPKWPEFAADLVEATANFIKYTELEPWTSL